MARVRPTLVVAGFLLVGGAAAGIVGGRAVVLEEEAARFRALDHAEADAKWAASLLATVPSLAAKGVVDPRLGPPAVHWHIGQPLAIQEDGDDRLLFDEAAWLTRARDDLPAALRILKRLAGDSPGTPLAGAAAAQAGALLLRTGDLGGARPLLETAVAADSEAPGPEGLPWREVALFHLARADLREGRTDAVVRFLVAAQDGTRLSSSDGLDPGDLVTALAEDLAVAPTDYDARVAERLSTAARSAREGRRWLGLLGSSGVLAQRGSFVVRDDSRIRAWPVEALGRLLEGGASSVRVVTTLDARAAEQGVVEPVEGFPGTLAVVASPRASEGSGAVGIALVAGLVVYALGAGFALLAMARSLKASRMQEEFVAAVSHEMKTPIAAVSAMAEMLANGRVPSARGREYAERIRAEMQRLGTTVRNVLDASRIERGVQRLVSRRPSDPGEVVRTVADVVRPSLEARGFRFDVDVTPPPRPLPVDPEALTSVLGNLLDNAAKFSTEQKEILLRAGPKAGGYEIQVLDRGPGVPRSERARVFERFARGEAAVREAIPGVGLGLHVAKELVEAHGGTIRIEDREGGGAAFVVELPEGVS